MENITIGQISIFIAFLVALVKGIEYLFQKFQKTAQEWLKKGLEPINTKLDGIDKKIDSVDMNSTKNFLIARFEDVNRNEIDETTRQRLYEQYEHYIKLGGNSYIKERFDELHKEGKI